MSKQPEVTEPHRMDPVALLKGLVSLRRLTGLYPAGHPAIEQKLAELDDTLQRHIREAAALRIDVIHGAAHLDGVPVQAGQRSAVADPARADRSRHRQHPFRRQACRVQSCWRSSEFLWQLKEAAAPASRSTPSCAARHIQHISLGRLVPLDTRWKTVQWPDAPSARSIRPTNCRWRSPSGHSTT